jgi:hypothetical protein
MPNTMSVEVIRREYALRYGNESPLVTKEIMRLWQTTSRSKARGQNVPRDVLDARLAETLTLMHERSVAVKATAIVFTQYLRPHGRKQMVEIERPQPVIDLAVKIARLGFRFELEHLNVAAGLPDVSLTIVDGSVDEDAAIELCRNGPDVPVTVDRLVENFARKKGLLP